MVENVRKIGMEKEVKRIRFEEENMEKKDEKQNPRRRKTMGLEDVEVYHSNEITNPYPEDERRGSIYNISGAKGGLFFSNVPITWSQVGYLSHGKRFRLFLGLCFFVAYNVYLGFAIRYSSNNEERSGDLRFLLSLTCLAYVAFAYQIYLKKRVVRPLWAKLKILVISESFYHGFEMGLLKTICWCLVFMAFLIFLIMDTTEQKLRMHSLVGLFILLGFGYVFSFNRAQVKWRPIIWGIFIQYSLGLMVVRWPLGQSILSVIELKIFAFLSFTDYGSTAVYGYLVTGKLQDVNTNTEYIFIYKNLSVIVFVSIVMSVLYHFGIMQKVIMKVGWILEKTMGTTCCESMAAAANIIFTMPVACLTIKPYMGIMTKSEMHAVLTGGFSTIACNVFVAYVRLGARANYLLIASVLSAPASLAFSKLFYPETQKSLTRPWNVVVYKGETQSCVEAMVTGATNGMELILKLSGNLIGFVSFISFINFLPGWLGELVGMEFLSTKWFMSKIFYPAAYVIGVESADRGKVAWLIAVNFLFTNMAGYKIMGDMKNSNILTGRSELLATFAICGFGNLSSVGMAYATLSTLVPERKSELSSIVMRSLIAGTCSCLMTCCIVGSLTKEINIAEFATFNDTSTMYTEMFDLAALN